MVIINKESESLWKELKINNIESHLDEIILCSILSEPGCGYEILGYAKGFFKCGVPLPTLYSRLKSLKKKQVIRSENVPWGRRHKTVYYPIPETQTYLKTLVEVDNENSGSIKKMRETIKCLPCQKLHNNQSNCP